MDFRQQWLPLKERLIGVENHVEFTSSLATGYPTGALRYGLGDTILGCGQEYLEFATRVRDSGVPVSEPMEGFRVTLETLVKKLEGLAKALWNNHSTDMWQLLLTMRAWGGYFEATVLRGSQELGVLVEASLGALRARLATESSYRSDWQTAYQNDEDTLERLGGALFRQRDIWAVKIGDGNQITDLVLQEPPNEGEVHQARGLILTEWKRVTLKAVPNRNGDMPSSLSSNEYVNPKHLDATTTSWRVCAGWRQKLQEKVLEAIREAEVQSWVYRDGALQGALLQKVRYLFIVCPDSVALPLREHVLPSGTIVRIRFVDVSESPLRPSDLSRITNLSQEAVREALSGRN